MRAGGVLPPARHESKLQGSGGSVNSWAKTELLARIHRVATIPSVARRCFAKQNRVPVSQEVRVVIKVSIVTPSRPLRHPWSTRADMTGINEFPNPQLVNGSERRNCRPRCRGGRHEPACPADAGRLPSIAAAGPEQKAARSPGSAGRNRWPRDAAHLAACPGCIRSVNQTGPVGGPPRARRNEDHSVNAKSNPRRRERPDRGRIRCYSLTTTARLSIIAKRYVFAANRHCTVTQHVY